MKKIFKIIFTLILMFSLVFYVNAIESFEQKTEDELSPKSQKEVEASIKGNQEYCNKDSKVKGCVYDEKSSDYITFDKNIDFETYDYIFPVDKVPLTRGYVAFNGEGQAVFAGCYKYKYKASDFVGHTIHDQLTNKDIPKGDQGTVYLFKIVAPKKGSCKTVMTFHVFAKGVRNNWLSDTVNMKDTYYDGTLESSYYATVADMGGWTATEDGSCPRYFGYTANVKWYTSDKHIYYFSENANDFNGYDVRAFWSNEEYVTRPGCTVVDDEGEKKFQEQLDKIVKEIKNRTCPSDIKDINKIGEKFNEWYKSFTEDNEEWTLYSRGLSEKLKIDEAKTKIRAAIKEKLVSCQYKSCNLTDSEISKISSNRREACKNGCLLNNLTKHSSSEGAMCFACGNSSGLTYKWVEPGDPSVKSTTCVKQPNRTESQCIGTSSDEVCRQCLATSYKDAGLNQSKIECLTNIELATELAERQLELELKETADESVEEEMEANEELRDKMQSGYFNAVELFFNEPLTCAEVLDGVLLKIVKTGITIMQIVAAIIAIVKGMLLVVPAVVAKDADALKKASKQLVIIGILLALIIAFRPLVRLIGIIFDYDVSCVL